MKILKSVILLMLSVQVVYGLALIKGKNSVAATTLAQFDGNFRACYYKRPKKGQAFIKSMKFLNNPQITSSVAIYKSLNGNYDNMDNDNQKIYFVEIVNQPINSFRSKKIKGKITLNVGHHVKDEGLFTYFTGKRSWKKEQVTLSLGLDAESEKYTLITANDQALMFQNKLGTLVEFISEDAPCSYIQER